MYKQPNSVKLIFEQVVPRCLNFKLAVKELVSVHQGTIEYLKIVKNKTHKIERLEITFPDEGSIAITNKMSLTDNKEDSLHYKEI